MQVLTEFPKIGFLIVCMEKIVVNLIRGIFMVKLTRFEITRIISARSLQLSLGAPAFAKAAKGTTMLELARQEFDKRVVPIAVLRDFPDGSVERVEVN